jgi:hypothetical protein
MNVPGPCYVCRCSKPGLANVFFRVHAQIVDNFRSILSLAHGNFE